MAEVFETWFLQTKTYSVKTMAADDQARARVMASTETILN